MLHEYEFTKIKIKKVCVVSNKLLNYYKFNNVLIQSSKFTLYDLTLNDEVKSTYTIFATQGKSIITEQISEFIYYMRQNNVDYLIIAIFLACNISEIWTNDKDYFENPNAGNNDIIIINQNLKRLFQEKEFIKMVVIGFQNNQIAIPYIIRFFSFFDSPFFVPMNGRNLKPDLKWPKEYPQVMTAANHLLAVVDNYNFDTLKYIYPNKQQIESFLKMYRKATNKPTEIPFPYFNAIVENKLPVEFNLTLLLSPEYFLSISRDYNEYNIPKMYPDPTSFTYMQEYEKHHGITNDMYDRPIEEWVTISNYPCYGLFFDYKKDLPTLCENINVCKCTIDKKVDLFTSLFKAFQSHPTWLSAMQNKSLKALQELPLRDTSLTIETLFVLYLKIPSASADIFQKISNEEAFETYLKYNEGGYELFQQVLDSFQKDKNISKYLGFLQKIKDYSEFILFTEEYGKNTYKEEMLKDIMLYSEQILYQIEKRIRDPFI